MSNSELNKIRKNQEEEQEEVLEDLIQNVRGLKGGQHAVGGEL